MAPDSVRPRTFSIVLPNLIHQSKKRNLAWVLPVACGRRAGKSASRILTPVKNFCCGIKLFLSNFENYKNFLPLHPKVRLWRTLVFRTVSLCGTKKFLKNFIGRYKIGRFFKPLFTDLLNLSKWNTIIIRRLKLKAVDRSLGEVVT